MDSAGLFPIFSYKFALVASVGCCDSCSKTKQKKKNYDKIETNAKILLDNKKNATELIFCFMHFHSFLLIGFFFLFAYSKHSWHYLVGLLSQTARSSMHKHSKITMFQRKEKSE